VANNFSEGEAPRSYFIKLLIIIIITILVDYYFAAYV
jgi:hypothetical protein